MSNRLQRLISRDENAIAGMLAAAVTALILHLLHLS
jgi:hypothetical protein